MKLPLLITVLFFNFLSVYHSNAARIFNYNITNRKNYNIFNSLLTTDKKTIIAKKEIYTSPTPIIKSTISNPSSGTGNQNYNRIHLTIGPEFAYYPGFLNKSVSWTNDSTGFGMKQNVGGSLRFDYLFFSRLGLSLTAGYYGWELVRNYTRNNFAEYTESKRLTQIPVQIGLKLYPLNKFYIMPEGGLNLLFASVKTSDTHPTPANESIQSTPTTYGASIGYEIRSKSAIVDLSIRYQLLNVNNLRYNDFNQSLNEKVGISSIRLGIGFGAKNK